LDNKERDELKALSIVEASLLAEMMQTNGWKIFKGMADKVMDVNRLKLKPGSLKEIEFKDYLYVAGQVEGVDRLFRQVESSLRQGDRLAKEEKQPLTPPL
jgi:hypothetical protein